jgi:hypothetical protein
MALLLSFVVFVVANNAPPRLTTGVPGENDGTQVDE